MPISAAMMMIVSTSADGRRGPELLAGWPEPDPPELSPSFPPDPEPNRPPPNGFADPNP
ncbi:hypothetical protein GCM10009650_23110 [Nesterenkonia jeotgali]